MYSTRFLIGFLKVQKVFAMFSGGLLGNKEYNTLVPDSLLLKDSF